MANVTMTQTMSKSEQSKKAMELKVDLKEVESRGVTDQRDYPVLPGEKVSRYRFMSFYLEGSDDHWHDFFTTVVDPEWLASNAEGARALRQTAEVAPNKVWRVFHRVTYVERPALMGFGRSQSVRAEEPSEIKEVREQVSDLKEKVKWIQAEIANKWNLAIPAGEGPDNKQSEGQNTG